MGDPTNIGRTSRQVPAELREAVLARDRGCAYSGCDIDDPAKLFMHHIVGWADGGETGMGNLTVLCKEHHEIVHFTAWEMRMILGTPMCIPPSYIDKERKPRANLAFCLPHTHPHLWRKEIVDMFVRHEEKTRRSPR